MTHTEPARARVLWTALVFAVALAAYRDTPALPFFWDDVLHYEWLNRVSLLDVWRAPLEGLNYFRPVPFTIWKLVFDLAGSHPPALYHAINATLHGLNACMLAALARRLAPRRGLFASVGAGLMFALFPFSFQAVTPVNSLTHPAHVALILLALLCQARSDSRAVWRIASALFCFLAVMAHENGVLSAALITLFVLLGQAPVAGGGWRRSGRDILRLWPQWLAVVLGFAWWQHVPRLGPALSAGAFQFGRESQFQNATYFLQGLMFPITQYARQLQQAAAIADDGRAIALLALPAALLWAALSLRAGAGRLAAFGLGWFALAALPAVLLLDFNYVLESPRLMYLASAGACLFLAGPLGPAPAGLDSADRRALAAAACVFVAGACVTGWRYLDQRAALYRQMGAAIGQLPTAGQSVDARCANGAAAPSLMINFPEWFFVSQPEYLVGHDGLKTIAEGRGLSDLYAVNHSSAHLFDTATLPDIQQPGQPYKSLGQTQTYDSLHAMAASVNRVYVTRWAAPGGVHVIDAGCKAQAITPPAAATRFGGALTLLSGMVRRRANGDASVEMLWRMDKPLPGDVTVFAQLIGADGRLVAQADGYPLAGALPMRLWKPGESWLDVRHIPLGALDPAQAHVWVGLYTPADGKRLPAEQGAARLDNDALVLPIH